jgi:formylglycine-generating enzyme
MTFLNMKRRTAFLVFPVIMGMCSILTTGCRKDKVDNNNPVPLNLDFVQIPAGTFTMGSPASDDWAGSDETEHQVTLSAFKMTRFEITNAQYAIFLNAKNIGRNGLDAAGTNPEEALIDAYSGVFECFLHYIDGQWVPDAGYENNPVLCVSWYGATEFAAYAGGSLPTEAQWEYACRGNTTTPFNTGDCLTNLQANYCWIYSFRDCPNTNTTYPDKVLAVGTYPANAFGLFDMHGNVREMCSDWYGSYPTTPQTNPTGFVPIGSTLGYYHVERGGSFVDSPKFCRSASRFFGGSKGCDYVGFRVVLVP